MTDLPRARLVRGPIGPAPRHVPRRIVLRLLFGGWPNQLVWLFPVFGMATALGVQTSRIRYSASTTGTITNVVDTHREKNDDEVYRAEFDLTDGTGTVHHGSLETTERVAPGPHALQYDPGHPEDARLSVGTVSRGVDTTAALFAVAIGLLAALGLAESGRIALRLLRYGEPTTGRIVEKIPGDGDDSPRLVFEYRAAGAVRRVTVTAHRRLEDDAEEPMLYDVKNPDSAVTLDDLPGTPEIREDGSLATRPGLGIHVLVLPGVFCVLAVSWLLLLFRS